MGKRKVKKQHLYICLSVLLVVVLAIGVILIFSGNNEPKNISISIGDATALAGDTVKLPFSMDGNSAVWGGQVIINYDASAFEYVSCSNGEVFDFCEDNDNKGQLAIVVTQMDDKNTDKNGLVATLNFKVKATADDGEYKIYFDKETNFSNIEGELKEVSFKSGTVTIK
ncbi:MAG: hypothetical protein IJZ63_05895 [Clostridia bacterium]|nr:hypothetical protein [Clostridia bacterium]